jgi:hypothetical protein
MQDRLDQAWRDAEFGAMVRIQARKHRAPITVRVARDGAFEIRGPRRRRIRAAAWAILFAALGWLACATIGGCACAS